MKPIGIYWILQDFKRGEGAPANDTLNRGNYNGKIWIGAEADVSIRKGWFYHKEEDSTVKSATTLFDLYLKSVGRGGNLLLNVPPNTKGLIDPLDSAALIQFKNIRDKAFGINIFKGAKILHSKNGIEVHLNKETEINTLILKEQIAFGQRVVKFEVSGGNHLSQFQKLTEGTTIGHKRILQFPNTKLKYLRIKVIESKATPLISEAEAYKIQELFFVQISMWAT